MTTNKTAWNVKFLQVPQENDFEDSKRALIILNQPFSLPLLTRLWETTQWHCCADGGANHLFDSFKHPERHKYLPDLITGDFDSLRADVRNYFVSSGVTVTQDTDQDTTDLMKCMHSLEKLEKSEQTKYDVVLLGGLSGRLDQTIHTLSYLHKLRKVRQRVFAVTDDNVGWVLDSGEHKIAIDHDLLGQTCGLLPVGIDSTVLSTSGLRWNLDEHPSSFDGLVSTSNHLVPGENTVWIKTTKPIWWTAELKPMSVSNV